MDHLVHLDHDAPILGYPETLGFYLRVEHLELARPVFTNAIVPMNAATLHTIGPIHIRMHAGKHCINLATIEDTLVAKKIGQMSTALMSQINDCLKVALDLP